MTIRSAKRISFDASMERKRPSLAGELRLGDFSEEQTRPLPPSALERFPCSMRAVAAATLAAARISRRLNHRANGLLPRGPTYSAIPNE